MSDDDEDYEDDPGNDIPVFEKPSLDDLEEHDLKAASTKALKILDDRNNTENFFDDENLGRGLLFLIVFVSNSDFLLLAWYR